MKTLTTQQFILGLIATTLFATGSMAHAAEKSCIGGDVKPVKVRAGASGFQDEDITIVEGVSGPEIRIGKSIIFLDPSANDDPKNPKKSGDSSSNSWCFVDAEVARQAQEKNPLTPVCGESPFGKSSKDAQGNTTFEKPITINGSKGGPSVKITAKEVRDESGVKRIQLIISPAGSPDSKRDNNIVLSGTNDGDENRKKVKLKIESKQIASPAKVNGALESEVEGAIAKDAGNDPRSGKTFSKCANPNQAKGQLRQSENKASDNWMDISGNQITMRGNEVPVQDQFGDEKKEPKRETVSDVGRSGGVS